MANYGLQRDDNQPTVRPQKVKDAMSARGEKQDSVGEGVKASDLSRFSADTIPGYLAIHSDELQGLREQVQLLVEAIEPILLPDRCVEMKPADEEDGPELSHVASLVDDNTSTVRYLQRRIAGIRERIQL